MEQVIGQHVARGPDSQLVERFAASRDEAAFRELVDRHGPMVLGVCRRVLQHAHDAEDAFQATFLVLARRAGAIRSHDAVGSWLYGVAYRIATKLKCSSSQQREQVKHLGRLTQTGTAQGDLLAAIVWQELRPVLDEELSQLPNKYRDPLVLCYLEGKTHDQAARELGWSKGSMSRRIDRARELLRGRLCQRGITLSTGVIFGVLVHHAASAAVPQTLAQHTVQAAATVAAGAATAGIVSGQVVALAEGVVQAMLVTRFKVAALVAAAVMILSAGGSIATYGALAQEGQTAPGAGFGEPPSVPAPGGSGSAQGPTGATPARTQSSKENAAATGPNPFNRPPSSTYDLRQRLSQPTDVLRAGIAPGTPLSEALDFLRKSTQLRIRVDYGAFAREDIRREDIDSTPVVLSPMPETTLAIALREMLSLVAPKDGSGSVTYVIRGKDLVVVPARHVLVDMDVSPDLGGTAVTALREPVQVNAEDRPLAEALRELADATGTNIIVDVRLKEKAKVPVTAILNHVPLETAVRLLADMADVKAVSLDNVIYVTSVENAAKLENELWARANGGAFGGLPGGGSGAGFGPGGGEAWLRPLGPWGGSGAGFGSGGGMGSSPAGGGGAGMVPPRNANPAGGKDSP